MRTIIGPVTAATKHGNAIVVDLIVRRLIHSGAAFPLESFA